MKNKKLLRSDNMKKSKFASLTTALVLSLSAFAGCGGGGGGGKIDDDKAWNTLKAAKPFSLFLRVAT